MRKHHNKMGNLQKGLKLQQAAIQVVPLIHITVEIILAAPADDPPVSHCSVRLSSDSLIALRWFIHLADF